MEKTPDQDLSQAQGAPGKVNLEKSSGLLGEPGGSFDRRSVEG